MKGRMVQELHLGNEQPGGGELTSSMWFDQLSHPMSLQQQGQLLHLVPVLGWAVGGKAVL